MKLTRLVLSGFKSFADTIDLPFEDGVTAIVGPNGCGKSNISDAVRWVLGEQRARVLRGARMDEVIFQGSAKRHPVGLAEVTLHFDNSDGTLPIAYHEVAITRRLSRSGQSDYLLNQAPVRLRDVQDLLRGTGLGGDAGVVIEGGAIERLLSDRPDERRSLFEEAAAIGLYRDRRISTERRLEQTGEDLVRLDDRIAEVQTLVRSLARQRGKAERHRKLRDDRFALVIAVARFDLAMVAERATALDAERGDLGIAIPGSRSALVERERQREGQVQARATALARRTEVERRLAAARIEAERLEGDLNLTAERQANAARRVERAREERSQLAAIVTQTEREREAAAAERQAAAAARESVQMELDLRTATEGEAREHLAGQRQRVRELEDTLQRHAERRRALAVEGTALARDLDDLRQSVGDAEGRREAAEREKQAAAARLSSARDALGECERANQDAVTSLERGRQLVAAARERESAVRADHRSATEVQAQLTARREALEDLEREHVGLAPAALSLLRERGRFGDGAVLGPLSDYLRTGPDSAALAERLLGDWLHAVLVRDEAAASAVREWHDTTQPGPLVLLPVHPGPRQNGYAEPSAAQVSAIEPAAAWSRALLAGQQPLDSQAGAIRRPNGAVFIPGRQGGAGPLQRRAELDRLHTELEQTGRRVTDLERDITTAGEALATADLAVIAATAGVEQARVAMREAQAAGDDALRLLQRAEREWTEAGDTLARARQRVDERTARLREVAQELNGLDAERANMDSTLAGQRAALAELEGAQEAARERRVHWQVEEAQVSARAEAAQEREARAVAALTAAGERITALDREVAEIEATGGDLAKKRAEWSDALAERRVAVVELEAASRDADSAVHSAEQGLDTAEAAVEQARAEVGRLTDRSHRLDLETAEITAQRRALVERLETEWRRPVDELLATAPAVEGDAGMLREEAEQLAAAIEALGPVNPLAVDEHAEESRRLEDLSTQRADIIAARESLRHALREIDETARTMFVETFAAIRENFRTVFQTLFEGGECDVRLADEADPLNSDIEIHAAPRGKRTQRIHLLSSGERALVAVSLLFAIYLTKPSPFCLLDEVDAPLDDANVVRFVRLLREFKAETQFIVITHNPRTMQVADTVYGVTMQEPGVSTIVGVRLGELEPV